MGLHLKNNNINSEYYQLEVVIQLLISMNKIKNNENMKDIINSLKNILKNNTTYKKTAEIANKSIKKCLNKLPKLMETFDNLQIMMNPNDNNNSIAATKWLINDCLKHKSLPKIFIDLLNDKIKGKKLVNNRRFDELLTLIGEKSIITNNVLKIIHNKALISSDIKKMTQKLTGISEKCLNKIIKYNNDNINQIKKNKLKQFALQTSNIHDDAVKSLLTQWFDNAEQFDLLSFDSYLLNNRYFNESLLLTLAKYITNKPKINIIEVFEMLLKDCLENNILNKQITNSIEIILDNKKLKQLTKNHKIMVGKSIQDLLNICRQ